jgi:hypothetical protein
MFRTGVDLMQERVAGPMNCLVSPMAMDLISESGEEFSWGYSDWIWVLWLARAYGWEPAGAVPMEQHSRRSPTRRVGYATNDGQRVQVADARRLADALDRVLGDPDRHETAKRLARQVNKEVGAEDAPIQPWKLDEDALGALQDFAEFCRAGAFIIE